MPINEYDDMLTGGKPAAGNEYDALLGEQKQADTVQLRQSMTRASSTTPDRTAEVIKLSERTKMPVEIVERNLDAIRSKVEVEANDYDRMLQQSPKLVEFLKSGENAAVARDDLANLGALEWLVTAPRRAWSQGQAQVEFGHLRSQSIFRDLTADEHKRLAELRTTMESGGKLGAESWFGHALTGGARQLPMLFGGLEAGFRTGAPSAMGAAGAVALLGQAGPQAALPEEIATVPAAAATGYYLGQTAGSARFGFQMESGHAFEEFSKFKDELGQPLDPDVARAAAIAAGGINSGLEAFQLNTILRSIPGADKLAGAATRSAISKALASPTVRGALKDLMVGYGKVLSIETATEVAQRAVTILSGELGKAASGQDIKGRGAQEITRDLVDEGIEAAQAFTLLSAPGPVIRAGQDAIRIREAKKNEAFFQALGEGVQQSKTFTRLPEKLQEFIAQATKDGPIENVYMPVEAFTQYWQDKGVNPAEIAQELGVDTTLYEDAVRTGADLAVPMARYATKLAPTEHNRFFASEIRLAPDELNAREAAEVEQALADQAQQAVETEEQQAAAGSAASVREDVIGQLTGAGYDRGTVEAYGRMYEAAFRTLGERAGVDPMQLYQRYGLRIQRPLPGVLTEQRNVDQFDALLDRLRAGDVPKDRDMFGLSLTEFLREKGGVVDEGGELVGRDPDKDLRPFQRRLIQPTGMSLDRAREAAQEAGYLRADDPNAPARLDINDLLEAIGDDLSGRPVYSQRNENSERVAMAQALSQLEQYLYETGVDLNTMSNEEIKKLLARASERQGDQGADVTFEQAVSQRFARVKAGDTVDGRVVRDSIPNQSSIGASLTNYKILPGVREIPMSAMDREYIEGMRDKALDDRTQALADAISASGELNPLIVVADKDGLYILEGAHRYDALIKLGAKSFPAQVVLDLDSVSETAYQQGDTRTIQVDGIRRPVVNSLGQPIHPTIDGQFAFWRWFGDSKVVDEQGRPRVVYHGTQKDISEFAAERIGTNSNVFGSWQTGRSGIFFAVDPNLAAEFVDPTRDGGNIMPVYLSISDAIDLRKGFSEAQLNNLEANGLNPRYYNGLSVSQIWEAFDHENGGKEFVSHLRMDGYEGARISDHSMQDSNTEAWVAFDPTQIKSALGNRGTFDPLSGNILYQAATAFEPSPKQIKSRAFEKWFGKSKIVDDDGKPLVVYHGTTADFTSFDRSRGNIESDFGAGFYFTNTLEDVAENYAGEGPDLTQKIQLLAERIADETDRDYSDPEVIAEAKERLSVEHGGATMPVFLSIQNPVVVGGDGETYLTYEAVTDDEGEFTGDEKGTLVDFVMALRNVAEGYHDGDVDGLIGSIIEEAIDGGMTASRLQEIIKADENFGYFTDDNGTLASNEIVRQAFEEAGFDGIVDRTPFAKFGPRKIKGGYGAAIPVKGMAGMDEDTVHYIAFRPEQIKSAVGNDGSFDANDESILSQAEDTGDKRGRIRFGRDRQFNIDLLEKADLSTFIHESGHFYLEVIGDVVDELKASAAALNETQTRMVEDYAKVLKWLGVSDRSEIGVAQHEQWARGLEAYMREGNAPSVELRGIFARFRSWLINIYRSLTQLNVQLSDEVRGVMDRVFASDQEIEAATKEAEIAPLFTDAASAGMSDAEFKAYRETVQAAGDRARDQLQAKLVKQFTREREKWWKAERETMREEVAAEVYQQREYIALSAMRDGTLPDGSPLPEGIEQVKLDRKVLEEVYGKEFLKRLPRGTTATKGEGVHPDTAAELFGFTSGDALVTAIVNARPMKQLIEAEADVRMRERYGDMRTDGTMADAARLAVQNEERAKVIHAELKALRRKQREVAPFVQAERQRQAARTREGVASLQGIPPIAMFTRMAEGRISQLRSRDLKPMAYLMAARRSGRKAIEAAAKNDFEVAAVEKQRELLNVELYRAAQAAREEVDGIVDYMQSFGQAKKRARLGKAGQDYLDQIDGLLDRFEFARVPLKVLERRKALAAWVAEKERQGIPVNLPDDLVDEARRTNYKDMTVEEMRGLNDAVKHIEHLARLKNKLLKAKAKRELDEAVADIEQSIRDHAVAKARQIETRLPGDDAARLVRGWFASHRKLSSLARQMDGFEDGGQVWDYIIRPLNDAADAEATMNAEATEKLSALFAAYKGKDIAALYRKVDIPAVGASITKMGRLMVALNWGNEGNRARIMDGYKWNEAQVGAILDTLDERDWQFVQGVWDFINGYWPQIEAKEKRVNGVAPEKVDAVEVVTRFGTFKGGYFPIKYDDRQSAKAGANLESEFADIAKAASYVRASTRRGHTEARVEKVEMPVRLDFGVIFEHTQQVIHDLSHHETLLDLGRILGHKQIQSAIYDTYGEVVYREIKATLLDVAFGESPGVTPFEKSINWVRQGATIAGLAWNVTTSLLQPFGIAQSMVRVGPKWVGKGLSRWLRDAASIENTARWIQDRSPFMKQRHRTQLREINEIRNKAGLTTGKLSGWIDEALRTVTADHATKQGIVDSFFWLIHKGQQVADIPTWIGAYEKAMAEGNAEERAIALADQAVKDSQGGGQVHDLAGIQRGGPLLKLWTNFYSYFNVTWNLSVESARRTNYRDPVSIGRLAVDFLLLYTLPATLAALMKHALTGGDDDEEKLAGKLVRENLSYMLGVMVGLREIGSAVQGFHGYEGPAGTRFFSALSKLVKQADQGDLDGAFWRALNDTAGVLLHYPAGQVRRTVEGFAAMTEGKTANPLALLVGPPKE